jgi:molecular chaperone GrpE
MTRTWWDNEAILKQFRDWLSRTAQEVDVLDEGASTVSSDGCGQNRASREVPIAGLKQVVEALTAMRHESKLQTKSSRGLEESVQSARQGLDDAIRHFRSVQSREDEAAERGALPFVEAMASLDEAMWRAERAFGSTHRQMTDTVPQRVRQILAEELQPLPWWRKRLMGAWPTRVELRCAEIVARLNAEEFDRLLDGFRLIQERVRLELRRHGLKRIAVVGQRVDPTCMTVVAIAEDIQAAPETVVEELRPGYRWREKVIRFAEVRAVAASKVQTFHHTLGVSK